MKRIAILFAGLAAMISCSKEIVENTPPVEENTRTYDGLVFQLDPTAKTSLDPSDGNVSFSAGDLVKILYGSSEGQGQVQSDEDGLYLETDVPETAEGPFFAVYPASNAARLAEDVLTVDIPRVNSGKWEDVSILAACPDKEQMKFSFKHACAYLSIEVSEARPGAPDSPDLRRSVLRYATE